MTDRELMQQALDLLDDINQCSLPPTGIPLPAEIDHVMKALRARLAQPEQEHSEQWWRHEVSNAYANGYEKGRASVKQPEQEPVAWIYSHKGQKSVSMNYVAGVRAIPLYTAPPQQPEQEPINYEEWNYNPMTGKPLWDKQPEPEPVATLFGSLPVYDVPSKQKPVAWMHNFIDEVVIAHRPADLDRHPDRWTALYKDPTPCQTCEALARTVMMDQVSYDIPPRHREPPTQDLSAPLTVNGVPMYPQREWQGLTDDEMRGFVDDFLSPEKSAREVFNAIEAKLKEKNND